MEVSRLLVRSHLGEWICQRTLSTSDINLERCEMCVRKLHHLVDIKKDSITLQQVQKQRSEYRVLAECVSRRL